MTKYIFSSAVNYESATGFKVSGKCNKLWSVCWSRRNLQL